MKLADLLRWLSCFLFGFWIFVGFPFEASADTPWRENAKRLWVPVPVKEDGGSDRTSSHEFVWRQFAKEYNCFDTICDKMLRHAHELSRLKLIRRYVRDTVITLDRFVTALDAELIASGENLQKSLGDSCRTASAVLNDVVQDSFETEGLRR